MLLVYSCFRSDEPRPFVIDAGNSIVVRFGQLSHNRERGITDKSKRYIVKYDQDKSLEIVHDTNGSMIRISYDQKEYSYEAAFISSPMWTRNAREVVFEAYEHYHKGVAWVGLKASGQHFVIWSKEAGFKNIPIADPNSRVQQSMDGSIFSTESNRTSNYDGILSLTCIQVPELIVSQKRVEMPAGLRTVLSERVGWALTDVVLVSKSAVIFGTHQKGMGGMIFLDLQTNKFEVSITRGEVIDICGSKDGAAFLIRNADGGYEIATMSSTGKIVKTERVAHSE